MKKNKNIENKRSRSNKFMLSKPYLNSTGPGEYSLPNLWTVSGQGNSKNKVNPSFSIGKRCKTPIISKEHTQDIKGKGKIKFHNYI